MRTSTTGSRTAFIVAACVILGLVIAVEFVFGFVGLPSVPEQPALTAKGLPETDGAVPPPPEFRLPGIARYAEITDRPLFVQGRRGAAVAFETTPTGIDNLSLIGTIIMPDSRRALFHEKDGRTYRIVEGQSILGWRLAKVHPESAVLVNGPQQSTLPLRKYSKPGSAVFSARPEPVPASSARPAASDPTPAATVGPAARAERETRRTGPGNGKNKKRKEQ